MADDRRLRRFRRWHIPAALVLVAALFLLGRWGANAVPALLERIRDLGPWAAAGFVAIYAAATVAWVPGSLLTLAGGAIFGLAGGVVYALSGALIGATLAFLIARYIARSAVERRLSASRKLSAVDEAIEAEGAKVVFLLRLSPVFPFNALNYALGLTGVRLRDFVAASAVGMIPGTFLYVYAGHTADQVVTAAAGQPRGAGYYVLLALGLLATVVVTVLVTRAARRALDQSAGPDLTRQGGNHIDD